MDHPIPEILLVVPIGHESDLVVVRRRVREAALNQGLSSAAIESLLIAVTEIARNIVIHAGSGEILFQAMQNGHDAGGRRGVMVTASDTGPGIPHIEQAMEDGFSTKGSLGLGLAGARRLVDEFELESQAGVGTRIILRKWA
jgi:serine/threonine-protein kinase RsbT